MSDTKYRIDFAEVKLAAPIDQVVQYLNIPGLKAKNSRQWKGTCPFCKGLDCFVVSLDGGREKSGAFNCFRCPVGGDQIELVSLTRGNPRKDPKGALAAAKELHERFCSPQGVTNRSDTSPQPKPEKRAGFDPEVYAKSLDPEHEALKTLAFDPETLRAWRAGFSSSGVLRGRLALPVTSKGGEILAYVGRALNDEAPILAFPNGFDPRAHIFGVDRVAEGPLYLVREPLDVLRAFESGCGNVVCFLSDDIAPIQLEALAGLMDERKCEALSFF